MPIMPVPVGRSEPYEILPRMDSRDARLLSDAREPSWEPSWEPGSARLLELPLWSEPESAGGGVEHMEAQIAQIAQQ